MSDQKTCPHDSLYWYGATNEDGWKCVDCNHRPGEPPGFSPEHDRSHVETKCFSILQDLDMAKIVSVSNGSAGDSLVESAAAQCRAENIYDSYSIARILVTMLAGDPNGEHGHAAYWKRVSEGVLSGNDPRERCHCGVLANVYTGGHGYCSQHVPGWTERVRA